MSISHILVPNNFNIFINSLNSTVSADINLLGFNIKRWTLQTIDATPTLAFSIPITLEGTYDIQNMTQGLSTVGDWLCWQRGDSVSLFNNILSYNIQMYGNPQQAPALATANVDLTVSGSNVNVTVTGVAGKIINWSGSLFIAF